MKYLKILIVLLVIIELFVIIIHFKNKKQTVTPTKGPMAHQSGAPVPSLPFPFPASSSSPAATLESPAATPTALPSVTSSPLETPSSPSPALPSPSASPAEGTRKDGDYAKGLKYYNAMDYDKAIGEFNALTKKTPGNLEAHYYLFLSYVQVEENAWSRKSNAHREAKTVLSLKPDKNIRENINKYFEDVKHREATVVAKVTPEAAKSPAASVKPSTAPSAPPTPQATQLAPPDLTGNSGVPTITSKDADIHYERAQGYDQKGNYRFALAEYSAAIKINPKHLNAYVSRGSLYETNKEYSQAVGDYSKAIELKPDDAKNYFRRGSVLKQMNDAERAKADLKKAKELDTSLTNTVDTLLKELETK
ncbi:MAG: tetratricopeptide repeat protein [Candidatus Eremiobacteraeota bacterium]|nr:tetratricopeptide repeat protein [Candidatus Eremiobacteraeota bacterium]